MSASHKPTPSPLSLLALCAALALAGKIAALGGRPDDVDNCRAMVAKNGGAAIEAIT